MVEPVGRHVERLAALSGRSAARVGVVGTGDWVEDVSAVAPAWRRRVVARVDPAGIATEAVSLAGVDELVVDSLAFSAVTSHVPYATRARMATLVGDDPAEIFAPALSTWARGCKRAVDIGLGAVALVLAAPVLAAAAVAIRLDSPGPVLFRQVRPGLNGRSFVLLKLRTMDVDNDDAEHRAYVATLIGGAGVRHRGLLKLVDDPRVTRVGRILRRYSIDELPQLINVLRGDMSLVGPRPPIAAEVDHYDADLWLRLRVKPGMTGAWQVAGRNELTYAEMVALDIDYWRHWSLWSELRILARTLPAVLGARGAA